MKRSEFIKAMALLPVAPYVMNLNDLNNIASAGGKTERMPALFIGHGSPMNGIEDNEFTKPWQELGRKLPKPKAVLIVSAHWLTKGTHVTAMSQPKTIHDFGGFPKALFDVQYPAPGDPAVAAQTKAIITSVEVGLDHEWGLDHGAWTIAKHIYPHADVPVLQLSIDYNKPPQYHYNLGKELGALRKKGVLILGSGNMVHNLRMVAFDKMNAGEYGFDWALEMKDKFHKNISNYNHKPLIDYESMGPAAKLAIPTPDHYYPLMYTLGMQEKGEEVRIFNDKAVAGSLTMTSVQIG
ncbi:MAG: 4,5-DOPA dioxygenase extradiol [Bacteroidota bacterium]